MHLALRILLFLLLPASGPLRAAGIDLSDAFGYHALSQPLSWTDISATGTAINPGDWVGGADDGYHQVNLPFNFRFYSAPYNKVSISSNGYVQFGSNSSFSGVNCLGAQTAPYSVAAAYWMDLDPGAGGGVRYQVLGSAGSYVAVIQFTNVPPRLGPGSLTFQVLLYEGSNDLTLQYLGTSTHDSGASAVAGLRALYDCPNRTSLPISCLQAQLPDGLAIHFSYPVPEPACGTPTVTPTFSVSPTITPSPSITPTFSDSPTATETPTITQTFTDSPTSSVSPTSSDTPTQTLSSTTSPTPSHSPTGTPTDTPGPSATSSPSPTVTRTVVALSDAFGYVALSAPYAWTEISGSGNPVTAWAGGADDGSAIVELGFDFQFYGNLYNKVTVASNGYLQFGTSSSDSGNNCLGASSPPSNIIALFWSDLHPGLGGAVYTQTSGSPGSRILVAQYESVPKAGGGGTVSAQAVLKEGGNGISLRWKDSSGLASGAAAVSGLRSLWDCPNRTSLPLSCNQPVLGSLSAVEVSYPLIEPACGTPTITPSPSASPSASPSFTESPTITPTFSDSPTITPTGSFTDSPTVSPTHSDSPTQSPTFSDSPTPTESFTGSPTSTISETFTVSPTATPSPTVSPSFTHSPTATPSSTPTPSPTATPTATRTISSTRTISATFTVTPTVTDTPIPPASKPGCLVLGQPDLSSSAGWPVTASSLSMPAGVALDQRSTPYRVYVSDSQNNRVLIWSDAAALSSGKPADGVIGQPDFVSRNPNRGSGAADNSFSQPWGLAVDPRNGNLFVADPGNHRVLRFDSPLPLLGAAASRVFGQAGSFSGSSPNAPGLGPDSLSQPMDLNVDGLGRLAVADTGNHRVLRYANADSNTTATEVFGQNGSFATNLPNQGLALPHAGTLNAPRGLVMTLGSLWIADTDNHRILRYNLAPLTNTASLVLGQADFVSGQANQGAGFPDESRLSSPRGIGLDPAGRIYAADSANHRVLAFDPPYDSQADYYFGQLTFNSSNFSCGADFLNFPQAVWPMAASNLLVADSFNHRVLVYGCASGVLIATATPSVSPTSTPTPTGTHTPTASPSSTITPTLTVSQSFTATQSFSFTPTFSITPTRSPSFSVTPTPSATPTATRSYTASPSPTRTGTPFLTATATPYPRVSDKAMSWPNPALRASGRVCFAFPASSRAEIQLFDLLAQPVLSLPASAVTAQAGLACWDMRESTGQVVAPGIYYYRVVLGDGKTYLGKMTLQ